MTKEQLLQELKHDTWVMMKPSPIHGNGVFALRDIPKGQRGLFSKNIGEWIKIERSEIDALPAHSKELVETYCLFDDAFYYVPDYGFKVMDIVNFLNHDDLPNIISINDGEDFETLREIKAGEELFIDYGEIVESDE
ncbi:MAG: SET domain-containing protein [Lacibacter sp.]